MLKVLIWLLACLWMVGGLAFPAQADQNDLKEQIRQILKENPEIILEALAQEKVKLFELAADGNRMLQQKRWEDSIKRRAKDPFVPKLEGRLGWLGPKDAGITIVEYSDFLCSACSLGAEYAQELLEKYPKEVRLLLKHNPSGDLSRQIAVYFEAICRQDPKKAWDFAELIFQENGKVRKEKLAAVQNIVNGLGLDQARLAQDLADPALEELVKADAKEADQFDLHGTPTFLINGVPLEGAAPVDVFEDLFDLIGLKPCPAD